MGNRLLGAALRYAQQGWAVLPLHTPDEEGACSCSLGAACGRNAGKHPRTMRGHVDATTDEQQIRKWWKQWPDANVAIRTGAASGLFVLDIDPRHGGDETLEHYIEQFGKLPDAPEVITGGDGRHYYYEFVPATRSVPIQGGIDIKSEGGYIVAPPSRHVSGNEYRWKVTPIQAKIQPPPDWVISEQRAKSREPIYPKHKITEGERHTACIKLAGWHRRLGHSSDFIFQAVSDFNVQWCEPPLMSDEINKIAYSADLWEGGPEVVMQRELNDNGNALRYVDRFNKHLRHTSTHGAMVWNTNHWERDELGLAQEMAKQAVDMIMNEVKPEWPVEMVERHRKWQLTSGNEPRLRAMMKLGFSDPRVAMRYEDFDQDPWLLNVFNGTVDLRSGKLQQHRQEDYITKLAPVWFDPKATCPTWEAHIKKVMMGNKRLAKYLQRLLGYGITGIVSESIFPIFYGSGQNGKSTLLRAIRNVVGTGYVTTAPSGFLMLKNREEHPTEIADLAGSRMIIASETGKGSRLNVEQMKQLTGEDRLKGRYMRQDYFEFPITFKVMYMTNHKPVVTNTETATWRRIKLIPFLASIAYEERDPLIDEKLRSEASGILNWLIEGCRDWQLNGMQEPDEVKAATEEYKSDSDLMGEFIREELVFGEGRKVSTDRLQVQYEGWAQEAGIAKTYSKKGLTVALKEREEFKGCEVYVGNGKRMWRGVGLKADAEVSKRLAETARRTR